MISAVYTILRPESLLAALMSTQTIFACIRRVVLLHFFTFAGLLVHVCIPEIMSLGTAMPIPTKKPCYRDDTVNFDTYRILQ